MKLKPDQRQPLLESLSYFKSNYLVAKYQPVVDRIPVANSVGDLEKLNFETAALFDLFQSWPSAQLIEFDDNLAPCLKRALVSYRLFYARMIDRYRTQTTHLESLQSLDAKIAPFDALINDPDFAAIKPLPLARVCDLISIQELDRSSESRKVAEREYDEKFHILQAPKHFLTDLAHYREVCNDRGSDVTVAYLDIDDFKQFNTKYGETEIDRRVLPRFMQALETQVFHHRFAYRYGGDEYVVLLPSLSRSMSVYFLEDLRKRLSLVSYRDISEKTTVSIGFCTVNEDVYLTDREIEERANAAKNFAKRNRKNCLATYSSSSFRNADLQIVEANSAK